MSSHLAIALALTLALLAGCRTTDGGRGVAAPVRIDAGSGSPEAVARRVATELVDAEILAALAPRAGALDRRYLVRMDHHEQAGSGTLQAFQSLFQHALVGTGRFLLVEDADAPMVRAHVSGSLGREHVCVSVRSAVGDEWLDVHATLDLPH